MYFTYSCFGSFSIYYLDLPTSLHIGFMEFVLNEIRSARRFVAARAKHSQHVDLTQIVQSFADKLAKLIVTHTFSAAEISVIMQELEDSPYSTEQTTALISSLDDKMISTLSEVEPTKAKEVHDGTHVAKSRLYQWWNYFCDADWKTFKNPYHSFFSKMELACHRARSFGCTDPDEQSVKWLLALLLKLHFDGVELPDALAKYRKFNDLKAIFVTEESRKHNAQAPPPLAVYPPCAADMPGSITSCFGSQLPINRDTSSEITGLANIAKLIPLRKTSALLKGNAPHEFDDTFSGTAVPAASRSSSARCGAASSHTSLESVESPSPKHEPAVKVEAKPGADQQHRNFCPSCGHHLQGVCSHAAPIKHEQPDKADEIRKRLRINGQPLSTPVQAALPEPVEHPKPPAPPELDDHALAAIAAMQNRKEVRKAAALEAKDEKVQDDASPDDADDDGDTGYPMKKPADITLEAMKKPGMKTDGMCKTTKSVIKRPGMHEGCMKCRGLGCAKCANPFFGG